MSAVVELKGDEPVFWGEIAPAEHLVEIYENGRVFLNSLEGFVMGGLRAGEGVIVIATRQNLNALEQRIWQQGFDLDAARSEDRYIALDAVNTLATFMVGGWPDENRFRHFVTSVLKHARGDGRRVRAFGEMVAVLWAHGHNAATVRLEHLWEELCRSEGFSLFCAYPRSGFTQDADASIQEICSAHSKVIRRATPHC